MEKLLSFLSLNFVLKESILKAASATRRPITTTMSLSPPNNSSNDRQMEQAIEKYYDATKDRLVRQDLITAVSLARENINQQLLRSKETTNVAIDCGCGAGSDVAYLLKCGFTVHAFDVEASAITRCQKRFSGDPMVHLTQASFADFSYPQASLIVADASLFFCPPDQFDAVWGHITNALVRGGVFVGSFLGQDDSMAQPSVTSKECCAEEAVKRRLDAAVYWPEVLVFSEEALKSRLEGVLEIVSWQEHRKTGQVPGGTGKSQPHSWHIFSVVAVKI